MTGDLRVMLEPGPTDRRVVATAPDWPGLERAAKTEDEAIPRLLSCAPRCAAVARLAGMDAEFPVAAAADIVGRYPGAGSTDFWGISFAFSDLDRQPMSADDLGRQPGLMWACRVLFEDARSRISAELRKGPRGGGRDRDQIDRHVIVSEHAPGEEARHACSDRTGAWRRRAARTGQHFGAAIRVYHARGTMARTRPLRHLIRHTAYHALDRVWELDDRRQSGDRA